MESDSDEPLSETEPNKGDFEAQFLYAAKNGHLARAERLLMDGSFDPAKDDCFILQWACKNGLGDVVKVLLKDNRVNVNCQDDICIQLACEVGQIDILRILLQDKRANPGCQNSIPLWLAAQNGHVELVKLLVLDPRVDINAKTDDMTALEVAVLHEYFDLAQVLLHSSKTDSLVERTLISKGKHEGGNRKRRTSSKSRSDTPPQQNDTSRRPSSKYRISMASRRASMKEPESIRSRKTSKIPNSEPNFIGAFNNRPPEEEIISIIKNRKENSLLKFQQQLSEIKASPKSKSFNKALNLVISRSGKKLKSESRGTCYLYIQELLNFGANFQDLVIEEQTIQAFKNYYNPLRQWVRNILNLRNRQNPIDILENFKTRQMG